MISYKLLVTPTVADVALGDCCKTRTCPIARAFNRALAPFIPNGWIDTDVRVEVMAGGANVWLWTGDMPLQHPLVAVAPFPRHITEWIGEYDCNKRMPVPDPFIVELRIYPSANLKLSL